MHRVHNLFPDDCRHLPPRATYRLGSLSFSWGVHVSHALTLFSIPPTSPSPHILHCQQGAESGDDGTRYRTRKHQGMKSRGYTTFHYLSSISHRIVFYCYGSFPSTRQYSFLFALLDEPRKSFWRFKFKFRKYLRYLHLA